MNYNFQVSHFCHAGAYTLSQLIHETKPKRVHSIVEFEICNDSMAKIPNEILNKGCATVNSFDVHHQLVDVTVDDTKSTHKSSAKIRSFLDPSTAIEEEMESEQILNTYEDTPNSMSNFILRYRKHLFFQNHLKCLDITNIQMF